MAGRRHKTHSWLCREPGEFALYELGGMCTVCAHLEVSGCIVDGLRGEATHRTVLPFAKRMDLQKLGVYSISETSCKNLTIT